MAMHSLCSSVVLVLTLGIGFSVSPAAMAQTASPAQPAVTSTLPKWMQALQLSPSQVQQVKAIETKNKTAVTQLQQKLNQAEEKLEAMIVSGAPNSQIRSQHAQVKALRSQFDDARFEVALQLKDILTAPQRQKLAELNKQRLANLKTQIQGNQANK